MANKTKLHIEVTDMAALEAAFPNAVKRVVEIREDRKELYALAKAHLVIGKPIPGVIITKPDGSMLTDAKIQTQQVEHHDAGIFQRKSSDAA